MCLCVFRLQHELSLVQQQLCESSCLVHSLQCELQQQRRQLGGASNTLTPLGSTSVTFDPRELHVQLEQQLSAGAPPARRCLFSGQCSLIGQEVVVVGGV